MSTGSYQSGVTSIGVRTGGGGGGGHPCGGPSPPNVEAIANIFLTVKMDFLIHIPAIIATIIQHKF